MSVRETDDTAPAVHVPEPELAFGGDARIVAVGRLRKAHVGKHETFARGLDPLDRSAQHIIRVGRKNRADVAVDPVIVAHIKRFRLRSGDGARADEYPVLDTGPVLVQRQKRIRIVRFDETRMSVGQNLGLLL